MKKNSPSDQDQKTEEKTHVSLYRKYRPQEFKNVIGQDHIVEVLSESIKNNQIAHAYLFCGGRGTGKTSIARIFARAIGTTEKDTYEIDAASNTSVEDIRNLNESVRTMPFDSQFKVYILDEVHMLSKSAFNAFLKTLEEPPKHAVFILATTEMQKLPDTVISRCQTFTFRKPSQDVLKKFVNQIAKNEGLEIEERAADLIALLGDGSFRDTLSVLQKVAASNEDKKTTLEKTEKITGAPKSELVLAYIESILNGKAVEAINTLSKLSTSGVDVKLFSDLVLDALRTMLHYKIGAKVGEESSGNDAGAGGDRGGDIKKIGDSVSPKKVANTIVAVLNAKAMIGKSSISVLPLELVAVEASAVGE